MSVIVDVLLVIAAVGAFAAGWRRGAVLTALPVVALVAGLWTGLKLAPPVVDFTVAMGWGSPVERTVVALIFVVLCASVAYGIAATIAGVIRRKTRKGVARGFDAIIGAILGVVTWSVVVWLLAGFLLTTNLLAVTSVVKDSRVVGALNQIAPVPVTDALGAVDTVLGQAGLPEVFSHGADPIRNVPAPDPDIPDAVNAAAASVVKIMAMQPACGTGSEGTGWVVANDRIMTNAHVVAAASQIYIQVSGTSAPRRAKLVEFDPERDLAVLAVSDLNVSPLELGSPLGSGDKAVVSGYPGGGSYTASAATVRETLDAVGTDIYKHSSVDREIYSLRAIVRPGNSGGPLFDTAGKVVGVVFAQSTTNSDTGYALTLTEVEPLLKNVESSMPVSSGACSVE